jgi:DNA-binding NtrC family response regulator
VKTVLIIDPDLGFVFWLGQILLSNGYDAFPAKGVPEANTLLGELGVEVHLLIINSSLAGAPNLVDELRRSTADLKVLVVAGDAASHIRQIPSPDAILRKPLHTDRVASSVWLRSVEELFARATLHRAVRSKTATE